MRTVLALVLLTLTSQALANVEVLKSVTCKNEKITVEIEATHMAGDRIALLEWRVFGDPELEDSFLAPLNSKDKTLQKFSGSTLGSDIVVEGLEAELTLENQFAKNPIQTFKLSCK